VGIKRGGLRLASKDAFRQELSLGSYFHSPGAL